MHKFNAQPSASYQPLGPRSEGEVIDERQFQFNTYSAVEGANHPQFHETRKEDVKLKTTIRILRFVSRLAATAIAIVTASQEAVTFATYLKTRNTQRDGRKPWATETSLWPTIMLLVISAITAILGLMIVIAYLISIKKANAISSVQTVASVIIEITHIIIWIIVAILYRVGKTGKDLWGWACSPLAENIQPSFDNVVHFNKVCARGSSSWHLALVSASVQILSGVVWYFVFRRLKVQKKIKSFG
ncbi:hypothetical protein LHYA1_G003072 [Lachnellula hyalina]|uniref:MARVEL domain-containing protein n=1 Tax=Lachnellula hyalina TaxID=1316788 RepID=A0A8H8TZ36_9HELO|nr:uncharacterized protein LHYA1_G003072 [Lachnellula hyalina]TVY27864.1 hypothetical protein LHYA1_G003072 [Lachnellula hyalina]